MNFAQMLMMDVRPQSSPEPKRAANKDMTAALTKARLIKCAAIDEGYRKLFAGRVLTTMEIANIKGCTRDGIHGSLKAMEKRGLIERAGNIASVRGRPMVTWRWVA